MKKSGLLLASALLSWNLAATAEIGFPVEALIGSWEGPLVIGRDNMNLAFTFSRSEEGFDATMTSGGLGIYGMPAPEVIVEGKELIIRIPRLDLEFTGTLRLDEADTAIERIDGDWFQYSEMVPVVLRPVDEPTF